MTSWDPQRIPIWVPPLPGEALDSWLAAYAARLTTPMKPFLQYLGLPKSSPDYMVRRLSDEERQVLAHRTGLTTDQVAEQTLAPWDGLMVSIDPSTRSLRRAPNALLSGRYSRYCPACLAESGGRWQRRWRLAWTFACARHHTLLLDTCPVCRMPPTLYKLKEMPIPGRCIQGSGNERCGFPLAQAASISLAADGPVLRAQQHVDATILASGIDRADALHRTGELVLLSRRALAGLHTQLADTPPKVREIIDDAGGTLPILLDRQDRPTAQHAALGVTIASAALTDTPDADESVLPWIMRSHPPGERGAPVTWAHRWAKGSQRLAAQAVAAVDSDVTLLTRLRYGSTTNSPGWTTLGPEAVEKRAAQLPSMLWPSWTARVMPRGSEAHRVAGLQRAAANLMLIPGSSCTYPKAAALLGNTPGAQAHWKALHALVGEQDLTVLATTLVLLARALDQYGAPIDYCRRRELFECGELAFDEGAVQRYCRRHGVMKGSSGTRSDLLRWRVRRLLLGADPGTSTRTPLWQRSTGHLVAAELRTLLHRQADTNLQAHGINEPVTWEPPSHWLPDLDWPGLAPEQIDHQTLAGLMEGLPSLQDLAQATGADSEHLRLHLETSGTPASSASFPARARSLRRQAAPKRSSMPAHTPLPARPPRRGGSPIPRQGVLAPETLRRLYVDQRLSTPKIAKLAGCTPSTVGRFLKEAGIPLRRREGPMVTAEGTPVSAEWLRREYVDRGRDTPDIARELDCHNAHVSHLMKQFGIAARPLFATANRFARLGVPLSPAMTAIAGLRNHVQRLRAIVQLPGHHDIASATRSLNVPSSSLRYQLDKVEQAAGFTIIARTHPLTPTAKGKELLAEATRLLDLLDSAAKTSAATASCATPDGAADTASGGKPGERHWLRTADRPGR